MLGILPTELQPQPKSVIAHSYNPSTQEPKAEELKNQRQPGLHTETL